MTAFATQAVPNAHAVRITWCESTSRVFFSSDTENREMSHPYTRRASRPSSSPSRLYSSWNAHHQAHWGRRTWDSLFLLASDFPHRRECDDDAEFSRAEVTRKRRAWRALLESLPNVLSCPVCGTHFRDYMRRYPLSRALQNRETLLRWLHRAKDEVNCRTGKRRVSYKRVRKRYVPPCS